MMEMNMFFFFLLSSNFEGYLSKKSIHINESFVHAIALALW